MGDLRFTDLLCWIRTDPSYHTDHCQMVWILANELRTCRIYEMSPLTSLTVSVFCLVFSHRKFWWGFIRVGKLADKNNKAVLTAVLTNVTFKLKKKTKMDTTKWVLRMRIRYSNLELYWCTRIDILINVALCLIAKTLCSLPY